MTPTDNYAFCGYPPFPQFIPEHDEHDRLIELLKAGCLPFAQLYQPEQKREYDYNGNSFKECGADQRYTNH